MKRKDYKIISLLLSFYLLLNIINLKNHDLQFVYGHNFTPNDYASFVSYVDQFQTEANLVDTNLVNNNLSLAQEHANEAFSIFYWDLMIEISEQDRKISDELKSAVESLQNITLLFPNSELAQSLSKTNDTTNDKQDQLLQQASQLITTIDTNTDIVINMTATRQQAEESSFFNQVVGFFSSIFTGQQQLPDSDNNNASIYPMRFAELIDSVLRNYGDAYNVNFDMTDMTNMAMMSNSSFADNNSSNQNTDTDTRNISSTMIHTDNMMNASNPLVNVKDYQSAQDLAAKSLEVFYNHLIPMMSENDTSVYGNSLEAGLIQLNNSIDEKVSPMNLMMIVHTQIHPNFIKAFDIQLQQ
jgi:hypothetical protein